MTGRRRHWAGSLVTRTTLLVILGVLAVLTFFPFYIMVIEATHTSKEILTTPPPLGPGTHALDNYASVIKVIPFWRNFANSVIISGSITLLTLFFCSLGGYAFAVYQFPLKRFLFAALLGTMMLPWLVNLIPWFIIVTRFHWLNSFLSLIIPSAVNAFGVFWMRQYVTSNVPLELLDAARIDGCPEGLIFFRIVVPIIGPALAALAIMNFLPNWNSFFYPLLVLVKKQVMTLPLVLNLLRGDPYRGMDYGVLMTATTMALAPVMIVFWLAARRFINGMTAGAVKG
jgi:ABC-type glycerol-3-phosphate transport system permease component